MKKNKELKPQGRNDGHETDYSVITKNIIIGSDLCKGKYCPIHREEFEKLGVDFEINLSKEKKEQTAGNVYGSYWIPVADGYPPTEKQIDLGTSIIEKVVKENKKIYVHCKNGHGRSPTMVAAYLIRYKGSTPEKAEKIIKEKRPEIHIEKIQMEGLNKYFKKYNKND